MAESFSFLCQILNANQARVSDQPNKLKVYVHTMNLNVTILYFLYIGYNSHGCTLGWSEKHKSWKMQQVKADSEPRHSTDFRTIFGIMIG